MFKNWSLHCCYQCLTVLTVANCPNHPCHWNIKVWLTFYYPETKKKYEKFMNANQIPSLESNGFVKLSTVAGTNSSCVRDTIFLRPISNMCLFFSQGKLQFAKLGWIEQLGFRLNYWKSGLKKMKILPFLELVGARKRMSFSIASLCRCEYYQKT